MEYKKKLTEYGHAEGRRASVQGWKTLALLRLIESSNWGRELGLGTLELEVYPNHRDYVKEKSQDSKRFKIIPVKYLDVLKSTFESAKEQLSGFGEVRSSELKGNQSSMYHELEDGRIIRASRLTFLPTQLKSLVEQCTQHQKP